jgi:hypothetical protein
MVYTEQVWHDAPATDTPVSAARLTHIEAGVKEQSDRATVLEARPIVNSPDDIGAQPVDSDLTAIAALAPPDDNLLQRKAGGWTHRSPADVKTDMVLVKADVGLSSVDNTSDAAKPVSTATQTALNLKASTVALTDGLATKAALAHTHPTTDITGFNTAVDVRVQLIVDAAPAALDTLNELAAALGDDPNFAGTITTTLAGKQPIDADLTSIAGLAPTNDDVIQRKAGAWTNRTPAQLKTDLAVTKTDVGLSNADNTSDAAKPVSTATQTALNLKAALTVTDALATAVGLKLDKAIVDAKGDLIVGSAADTSARLPVGGTDGHVLTVDAAQTLGVKWAAPAAGGGGSGFSAEAVRYGAMALTFDPHSLSWITPQYIEMSVARLYQYWLPLPVGTLVSSVVMPVQFQAAGGGALVFGVYQDDNSPLGNTGNVAATFQDPGVAETWVAAPLSVPAVSTGPGVWVVGLATVAAGPKLAFCNTSGPDQLPPWLLNPSSHRTALRTEGIGALPGTLDPGAATLYIDALMGVA